MKLSETQANTFIAEYYPPSPYNRKIEADTLRRAQHATEEERSLYLTREHPTDSLFSTFSGNEEIHIPVHCPYCRDHGWYTIHMRSIMLVSLGGLYATCKNCGRTFLPIHHTGHHTVHIPTFKTALTGCLLITLILIAIIILVNS